VAVVILVAHRLRIRLVVLVVHYNRVLLSVLQELINVSRTLLVVAYVHVASGADGLILIPQLQIFARMRNFQGWWLFFGLWLFLFITCKIVVQLDVALIHVFCGLYFVHLLVDMCARKVSLETRCGLGLEGRGWDATRFLSLVTRTLSLPLFEHWLVVIQLFFVFFFN
jgi:hypothetical protein